MDRLRPEGQEDLGLPDTTGEACHASRKACIAEA